MLDITCNQVSILFAHFDFIKHYVFWIRKGLSLDWSPRKIDPCFHDSRQCFFNVLRLKMKFVTLQYFTIFRKNFIIIDRNDSAMTLFSISHGCYLLIYLL